MNAYSPYDLLRTLIERVGWPVEEEKRVALSAVNDWEQMQIFGNLATMTTCTHPAEAVDRGTCTDCGKQITASSGNRNYRR